MTASYIHTTAICWWFNKYFLYIDMFLTHSVRFLPFDCWVLRSLEDSTSYMLLTSQFKVLEQTWNQRNRCFAFYIHVMSILYYVKITHTILLSQVHVMGVLLWRLEHGSFLVLEQEHNLYRQNSQEQFRRTCSGTKILHHFFRN